MRRGRSSLVGMRWPPSGVDEFKVLDLLPPDEQTARSQPWSAVVVECELPGLSVDLNRGCEVEILWLGIARGVRPLSIGIGVRTAEPGPRLQATTEPDHPPVGRPDPRMPRGRVGTARRASPATSRRSRSSLRSSHTPPSLAAHEPTRYGCRGGDGRVTATGLACTAGGRDRGCGSEGARRAHSCSGSFDPAPSPPGALQTWRR